MLPEGFFIAFSRKNEFLPNAKSEISATIAAVRHGGQFVDIPEVGNIGEIFDALYQTHIWIIDSNGNQTLISPPTRQMMMEAFASRTFVGGRTGAQIASQAQRGTRSKRELRLRKAMILSYSQLIQSIKQHYYIRTSLGTSIHKKENFIQ
ncbi:MAG: hypothetical protein EZS28_011787 [Streblomastix strix]|uniref:Uncharacterized protein n=1 Tax=Streblomastix strix TaxID=222440 RepID=A0A5J4WDV8_9EUKA|nr:MAG: hypothetical protein EZS28_011787 [Streblomastix strix]